jgi:type II secretory pathway pseudopilin PulG
MGLHQRAAASSRRVSTIACHRAFSLIEVLLAIFILGVGIISIAALFPAGIAQQRQSIDDILGPLVANNALAILRGKIRPEDFGAFEDYTPAGSPYLRSPRPTVIGDWPWMRPGFLFGDDTTTLAVNETGAIDIFSGSNSFTGLGAVAYATEFPGMSGYQTTNPSVVSVPPLHGIPFNRQIYGAAPRFVFTREERYYPQVSRSFVPTNAGAAGPEVPKPQYVWDCMFRRFQGKILVAIFVYRVNAPGGGSTLYSVAPSQGNNFPPVPIWLDLTQNATQQFSAGGLWKVGGLDGLLATPPNARDDNDLVYGNDVGTALDVADPRQAWEEPRQWILDQNNNIYRVLGVSRPDDNVANKVEVQMTRPLSFMPNVPVMWFPDVNDHFKVVSDIWYLPLVDGNGMSLTPVYVTVKEL